MEFRHVRSFLTLAETLSFSRAAGLLGLAQPALTKHIQSLETELGVQLFLRTRRTVSLTPEGQALIDDLQLAYDSSLRAGSLARDMRDGKRGTIRIGYVGSAAFAVLPMGMRTFLEQYADVQFELTEMITTQQIAALRRRDIDIAIVRDAPPNEWSERVLLRRDGFDVALPKNHPLTRQPSLSPRSLVRESMIFFNPHDAPGYHNAVASIFRHLGVRPQTRIMVNGVASALGFVSHGVGLAVLPQSAAGLGFQNVIFRRLRASPEYSELAMLYRKGEASALISNVARVFRNSANRLGALHGNGLGVSNAR